MKFLILISLSLVLGACSSKPKHPTERNPSSTPSTVLTIPVTDIENIVLADTAAITTCSKVADPSPSSELGAGIYSVQGHYDCSTVMPMAVSINNKAFNINKTFESFYNLSYKSYPSDKDLTTGAGHDSLHKSNVAIIVEHFQDIKAGCTGANVLVTVTGNEVSLEPSAHFGKVRCASIKAYRSVRGGIRNTYASAVQTYTSVQNKAVTTAQEARESLLATANKVKENVDTWQRQAREKAADAIRPDTPTSTLCGTRHAMLNNMCVNVQTGQASDRSCCPN